MRVVLLAFLIGTASSGVVLPLPDLKVSQGSLEGINLANQISDHFLTTPKPPEASIKPLSSSGIRSARLNLNINFDVRHGVLETLTLPQGNLVVLFFAKNPNNRVQVDATKLRQFMEQTSGSSRMIRIPTGALFMAWQRPGRKSKESVDQLHSNLVDDPSVAEAWSSGQVPTFPNYHGATLTPRISQSSDAFSEICKTVNGEKTCTTKRPKDRPNKGCFGFVLGGNCGGQNSRFGLNKNSTNTGFGLNKKSANSRFGLNKENLAFQNNLGNNRHSTTTTSTTAVTSTAGSVSALQRTSEMSKMAEHVMSMSAADLRHAIMDPMMLAMGTLMAMAGAYMAIMMAEVNAANAAALSLAG